MATLVFNSIGSALGGPIGGAIGSLIGSQVDGYLFGGAPRQGSRLTELAMTASTYGEPIPRHFGRMRVGGSIIWATDLAESSSIEGGKSSAGVTRYAYSANFAVALASRPILGIGRIWADGNLLRGSAGDLKVGGTLRIHTGEGDQPCDPLIAANEGEARCPAYRGLAYAVFEDLDLSQFYNRIPTLAFEVIADESFALADLIAGQVANVTADVPLSGFAGFSNDGALVDSLSTIAQVIPLAVHGGGEHIAICATDSADEVCEIGEAAVSFDENDFGTVAGYARNRDAPDERTPSVLRYYDVERDYLPGVQRAVGQARPGEPAEIGLPAALMAPSARDYIERTSRRIDWSRDRISWRTTELDPAVAPGAIVRLPDIPGRWRVNAWEWRDSGVELSLERCPPRTSGARPRQAASAGRAQTASDLPAAASSLVSFERPWDGIATSSNAPQLFAAASSSSSNWRGAALYVDNGDGELRPAGSSGRTRNIIGEVLGILPPAHPACFDWTSQLLVRLLGSDMQLVGATARQMAQGANLALVGEELIQFSEATALGQNQWLIAGFLRGRGGTEQALIAHQNGEPFVLLDGRATSIDANIAIHPETAQIVAMGLGDSGPVRSAVHLAGITTRPLAPVHGRSAYLADGSLSLSWTRRARGGWAWQDSVDVPLIEDSERYIVTAGAVDAPIAYWMTTTAQLEIAAANLPQLSGQHIAVRQQGTFDISPPLTILTLP